MESVSIPVVTTGGIADGRTMVAAFMKKINSQIYKGKCNGKTNYTGKK